MAKAESEKPEKPSSGYYDPEKFKNHEPADLLKRHGILFVAENWGNGVEHGVWISNTHAAIKEWLKDTPWATGWGRSLKRLPGAKSSDKVTIAFGKYDKTKAVWLPLEALSG
jgi:hypothetical protein